MPPSHTLPSVSTLILALAAIGAPALASDPDEPLADEELVERLEARIDELVAADRFSGTVLVAHGGKTLLRRAYGLASRRYDVPNRPDTKFNIGSMNKMFTGVAICQLVEAGKLSFDDLVGDVLPDYPNREVAEGVTLHHLLTHTSGMGSYFNEEWEKVWTSLREVRDLLPLFVDEPLAFQPGLRFSYSNAGPIVLGLVIEEVTGQSYYDYVREHVYEPCGMVNTDCYEMDLPVPNLAIGYWRPDPDGPWRNNLFVHSLKGGPAGGGYSTVDDLFHFAQGLLDGTLLGVEMIDTLLSPKIEIGPGEGYGYLFDSHRDGELVSYGHNGGAPGINAELSFFPDLDATVVVLSNVDRGAGPVAAFARGLVAR